MAVHDNAAPHGHGALGLHVLAQPLVPRVGERDLLAHLLQEVRGPDVRRQARDAQALQALKAERAYAPKVLAITGTNGKTTTTAMTALLEGVAQDAALDVEDRTAGAVARLQEVSALLGLTSIILGAMGAHGSVHDALVAAGKLDAWEVAVRYHLPHSMLLYILALFIGHGGKSARWAWRFQEAQRAAPGAA